MVGPDTTYVFFYNGHKIVMKVIENSDAQILTKLLFLFTSYQAL